MLPSTGILLISDGGIAGYKSLEPDPAEAPQLLDAATLWVIGALGG